MLTNNNKYLLRYAVLVSMLTASASITGCTSSEEKPPAANEMQTHRNGALNQQLAQALEATDFQTIASLLTLGADANTRDSRGRTAVFIAVMPDEINFDVMALAISKGGDINARDTDGGCALVELINKHPSKASSVVPPATFLIENGADINQACYRNATPLYMASKRCNPDIAALLIKKGANIEAIHDSGATPLNVAAEMGCLPVVKLLLKSKADINARDKGGRTPLKMASDAKRSDVVKYLRSKGAR